MLMKKLTSQRIKYAALICTSVFVSVFPMVAVMVLNFGKYTGYRAFDTVRLTTAMIIILTLAFLKAVGELKTPRRIVALACMCGVVYLLSPAMEDIFLICAMALLGELGDWIFLQTGLSRLREQLVASEERNE